MIRGQKTHLLWAIDSHRMLVLCFSGLQEHSYDAETCSNGASWGRGTRGAAIPPVVARIGLIGYQTWRVLCNRLR